MNFFLFWLETIMVRWGMDVVNALELFKDVADSGYKINSEKFLDYFQNSYPKLASSANSIPLNENKDLNKYIPVYNMLDGFKTLFDYNRNRYQILESFDALGLIEEMSEFEKQEYFKNPTYLNAFLVPMKYEKRLENAVKVDIKYKDRIGEIYFDIDQNENICILKTVGVASQISEEEQIELIGYGLLNLIKTPIENYLNELRQKQENGQSIELNSEEIELLQTFREMLLNEKENIENKNNDKSPQVLKKMKK